MLDIRIPISALFIVVGLLLVGYGVVVPASVDVPVNGTIYTFNLNRDWGAMILLFGIFMGALVRMDKPKSSE
ncbi:MAG TPA: hypothetical protein EYN91_23975 [Candidatus Melainabacteria bacterium]|jgi:hypothetical protein|nr:hypothetical protein [Candidatus Melainabacteria bacterium]HIN66013.1 hypothetical protein [Candidatus Obscuribacterales bacterium]